MANKIQIKRSVSNSTVTGLANGELAFTQAGNTLFIGAPDGTSGSIPIGGKFNYGILTANQALVTNSSSSIDEIRTANLVPRKVYANGAFGTSGDILSVDSGGNVYWTAAGTLTTSPAGVNTNIQFNDSDILGATAGFTFDKVSNNLTVGNTITVGTATINSTIYTGSVNNAFFANSSTHVNGKTESNLNVNNATTADTANNASYLGTVAAANYVQNTDSRVLSGNLTFSGANLVVSGTNTSISSNLTLGGTLTTVSSNVNITGGSINATSSTMRVRDVEVSGNLIINGTLTSVNTNSLIVKDSMIKVADQNSTTDTLDFGIYGQSGNLSSIFYAGLYRDHIASSLTNPVFKLFASNTEPTSIVDNTAPGYTLGTMYAYLQSAGVTTNSSVASIIANSSFAVNIVANTFTLSSPLAGNSGGTGYNTYTSQEILVANTTNGFNKLSLGTEGQVLQSNGTALIYSTLDGGTF